LLACCGSPAWTPFDAGVSACLYAKSDHSTCCYTLGDQCHELAVAEPHRLQVQLTLGFDEDPLAIRMVLEGLVRESDPTARLIPELGARGGAGRIDLAAAGSELVGWEIKGSRDSLVRLTRRADLYSQIFERLTLVAPERHLLAAEHCVPRWWA
jgi:hypothetical protein